MNSEPPGLARGTKEGGAPMISTIIGAVLALPGFIVALIQLKDWMKPREGRHRKQR